MLKHLFSLCLFSQLIISGATASSMSANVAGDDILALPRVALVVGNADYKDHPLKTPLDDARAMGDMLYNAGFEVIRLENASRKKLETALVELNERLGPAGTGLFYYAGHGLQLAQNRLLLPIDADAATPGSVFDSAVDVDSIVASMSQRRPGQPNILIIDACLDNPFSLSLPGANREHAGTGAITALPRQTLIAYATSPGSVAFDGLKEHGIYTQTLLGSLDETRLDIRQLFDRIKARVSHYTHGRQQPLTLSSLGPEFTPAPFGQRQTSTSRSQPSLLSVARLQTMTTRGILPSDGDAKYELEFWQSIKNSTDASDYEAYLEAYPNGRFAPLAKARVKRYKKSAPAAAPIVTPPVKPTVKTPAYTITDMDAQYEVTRNANIRKLPSATSTIVGELGSGSRVQVSGRVAGENWYRINSRGITGFVFGDLLRKPAPKPIPRPTAPVAKPAPSPTTAPVTQQAVGNIETIQDCSSCPELLALPAGAFTMGESRGDRSEKPAHTVSISKPFAIGKTEVTVGQWNECYRAGACSYQPDLGDTGENTPVRDVSWSDAREYTKWLSTVTKKAYRLPTEAEWEYAARAGSTTRFWWGNKTGVGQADCKDCGGKWDRKIPRDVTTYPTNAFGLYGTSGGVWEWVADCWHKSYDGAPKDGSAWTRPDCRENVIRGGAWRNDSSYIHSASRFKYDSNVRYVLNGFRVARPLP